MLMNVKDASDQYLFLHFLFE